MFILWEFSLPASWVTTDSTAVVVEAVKVCEELTRTIVVRLYESHGGSSSTTYVGVAQAFFR